MPRGRKKKVVEEVIVEETENVEEVVPCMKNVMCKETGEIMQVDANVEKDWKKKYLHVCGQPFDA